MLSKRPPKSERNFSSHDELLPEQVEAVRQLKRACQEAGVDAVIIGATAYRVWIDDDRRTQDVDVALAVDIDQLGSLTAACARRDGRRTQSERSAG